MAGLGGNHTASALGIVSDETVAPWSLLYVPFLGLTYVAGAACLELLTCKCPEFFRDVRELLKAMGTILGMVAATLLLLFLVASVPTDGNLPEAIKAFEYSFIVGMCGIAAVTSARAFQTQYPDKEVLGDEGWRPGNVYQDLADRSLMQSVTCFFGQNILFIYLMGGVFSGFEHFNDSPNVDLVKKIVAGKIPDLDNFGDNIIFLITSAFVQTLIFGQLGDSFEEAAPLWISFWMKFRGQTLQVFDRTVEKGKRNTGICFWRCIDEVEEMDGDASTGSLDSTEVEVGQWITLRSPVTGHELLVRMAMSWYANAVMRKLIVMLVPLMLITVDSYLDFVQNATALTFLVTLDDKTRGSKFRIKRVGSSREPLLAAPS